jgi:hypothetical protein
MQASYVGIDQHLNARGLTRVRRVGSETISILRREYNIFSAGLPIGARWIWRNSFVVVAHV